MNAPLLVPFDPNDTLTPQGQIPGMLLPKDFVTPDGLGSQIFDADAYLRQSKAIAIGPEMAAGTDQPLMKSGAGPKLPPAMYDAGRMVFQASAEYSGIIEWPGFRPSTLRAIARQAVAPQMIIGQRCADVSRYSELSKHSWKPGWKIELLDPKKPPDEAEAKDMREAEVFLQNSCIDFGLNQATKRDTAHYSSFANFLEMAVRDTLTYASIALWKDVANDGKVKSFALLPAGNIRFTGMRTADGRFVIGGFNGNPDIATCLVSDDETAAVQFFTREALTYYVRNPRTDIDIFGYGYPEIEQAHRAISGFQNALDMNTDAFTRSAIPHGILVIKGGQVTSKQLDLITRVWTNMKKGTSKMWDLPVIGLAEGGEMEVLDLSRMAGNEGYYKEFMNMLMGILCTLWKFPVNRLGYKASGQGHDTTPLPDAQVNETDADDPGLAPLLIHIENMINQYLLWTRWPMLRFSFTGKSPKEDARQYEARRNAMTFGEARAEADLKPAQIEYPDKDPKIKFAAKLLDMTPLDASMAGVWQGITAALIKAEFEPTGGDAETPGNRMTSPTDPAKSESHGRTSGVRRDSAKESSSS